MGVPPSFQDQLAGHLGHMINCCRDCDQTNPSTALSTQLSFLSTDHSETCRTPKSGGNGVRKNIHLNDSISKIHAGRLTKTTLTIHTTFRLFERIETFADIFLSRSKTNMFDYQWHTKFSAHPSSSVQMLSISEQESMALGGGLLDDDQSSSHQPVDNGWFGY